MNAETFLGRGGIGGFVLTPAAIGQDTARVALLVLGGTPASSIPITVGDAVRPIFDWRQLQRWGVPESRLPSRSEIRFRDRSAWDQYRWQIVTIALVLILQMILIIGLLTEHQRRRRAELESRRRASELAHMNRHATAGELSASIAHEINQPLGSILNNTESAILILGSASPNLDEVKEILNDIKRDDERAGEVILRLRRLLKKAEVETREFDLNETAREVLQFLAAEAALRNITLSSRLMPEPLLVRGDHVQLQQVILNLVVNGMESIADAPTGRRVIIGRTALLDHRSAQVSIADSGPGIPPDDLKRVFEPFFTTKEKGMGMGLSISRTIIEAHGGAIWAENQAAGGATFHVSLPLVKPH